MWVSESQNPYHFISHKWKQVCFVRLVFNSQCLGPSFCRAQPLAIQALVQSEASVTGPLAPVGSSALTSNVVFCSTFPALPVVLANGTDIFLRVLVFFICFGFTTGRTGASASPYFSELHTAQPALLASNVGQMKKVYSANRLASSLLRSFPEYLSDLSSMGS